MARKLVKIIEYKDGRREEIYRDEPDAEFDFSGLVQAVASVPGTNTTILIMVPEKYKDEKFTIYDNGKWRHIVCDKDSEMMKEHLKTGEWN